MSFKLVATSLLLTLVSTTALAQQTVTVIGRTPGSAANSGIRVVRVIPPPSTCASAAEVPSAASNAPVLPDLLFSRMELTCLRHSDGRFEQLPRRLILSLRDSFGQGVVIRETWGWMHYAFYVAFVGLFIGTTIVLINSDLRELFALFGLEPDEAASTIPTTIATSTASAVSRRRRITAYP